MSRVQTIEVPGGKAIPAKYAKMGASREHDPTPPQRLRIMLTGKPGHGKTTFVTSNPEALVLDVEDSARDVAGSKATRIYLTKYEDYEKLFDELVADGKAGKAPFSHIVFDTVGSYIDGILEPYLSKINGFTGTNRSIRDMDHGKGYDKIKKLLRTDLYRLYAAGYGWTVTCHIQETPYEDSVTGQQKFRQAPAITESVLKVLYPESQVHLTYVRYPRTVSTTKTVNTLKGGTKEVPTTTTELGYALGIRPVEASIERESKCRYLQHIKQTIEIPNPSEGWDEWCSAYEEAVQKAAKKNGQVE